MSVTESSTFENLLSIIFSRSIALVLESKYPPFLRELS
jgi:hypothetical protein